MSLPAIHPVFALLDDASPEGQARPRSRLYHGHAGTLVCHNAADADAAGAGWTGLLEQLQAALAHGLYAVPLLSYELGASLQRVAAHPLAAPLAQVLLFERMERLNAAQVGAWLDAQADVQTEVQTTAQADAAAPAGIARVRASVDAPAFTGAIERIRAYIEAGDTYQVNYTYRLRFEAFGSPFALYARLRARQPVPYGALVGLPDGRVVLSLSPELFVRHDAGRLMARPMKGTARAGSDEADNAVAARALAADPKNRAENLMIVDLLRNDLGRIARTGSVGVPALFEVRRYSQVLQMTSTVQAQLRPGTTLAQIFGALFPCGSITGAPKRRTMEIVHELEGSARGLYTGAIGWIDPPAPAADIGDFCLSVPIRTLVLQPQRDGVRRGEMGVGAGIVHDSVAHAEFAECQLKASFLTGMDNPFDLFETIYATRAAGCRHLDRHLARLAASSAYFGRPFDAALARDALDAAVAALPFDGAHRIRLALGPDGALNVQTGPLTALAQPVALLLADQPITSSDLFLRHKTSIRSRYDAAWRAAEGVGAFDTLFFNERGELAEGGRSTVFVRIGERWLTPPLSAGVLPGVMRAVLLDDPAWGAMECPISREALLHADEIVVCNALRGVLRAVLRR